MGVIWPFKIVNAKHALAKNTIKDIEKKLVKKNGIYRTPKDSYDGWMYRSVVREKKAGFWPLLNFWMAIVLYNAGQKKKAEKYYNKVINSINDDFIPEQIFDNYLQHSVSPLAWSHAMFVLASEKFGYIE